MEALLISSFREFEYCIRVGDVDLTTIWYEHRSVKSANKPCLVCSANQENQTINDAIVTNLAVFTLKIHQSRVTGLLARLNCFPYITTVWVVLQQKQYHARLVQRLNKSYIDGCKHSFSQENQTINDAIVTNLAVFTLKIHQSRVTGLLARLNCFPYITTVWVVLQQKQYHARLVQRLNKSYIDGCKHSFR
ncbi:hypothetical protein BDC45DRAFT_541544 [Circinella umbellata]|nr:hypothetical protein BDC45DRAFT_541544 [Circinella umbellata]